MSGTLWRHRPDNQFEPIALISPDILSLINSERYQVYHDSRNVIWITTFGNGLFALDQNDGQSYHYTTKDGLATNYLLCMTEDKSGEIWLGTKGGGLLIFPKNGNALPQTYLLNDNDNQTSSSNNIFSILRDSKNRMWIPSFGGGLHLAEQNSDKLTFRQINMQNGHQDMMRSIIQDHTGLIWVGTNEGVIVFDPDSIMEDEKIILNHDQNSFNLECTMFNFHAPELNQYTYYLEGYEKDWNTASRNGIATYRNVPSGTYNFKVKASNSFGVWNKQETNLQIIIRPPWWKSVWPIFIYIILTVIIACLTWRLIMKMHRLNMAVEIEHQLTEYKLRFFTNISHEFRTPLTIIRGSIENLSKQENVSTAIAKQLNVLAKSSSRLLRLIDQLLEFRRLQNNKMELNPELTDPNTFFHDIYLTFKEISEKKQIEFLFKSDNCDAILLDRSKMDKIAYNLLSNAFKNTPDGGQVLMELSHSENTETSVIDDRNIMLINVKLNTPDNKLTTDYSGELSRPVIYSY